MTKSTGSNSENQAIQKEYAQLASSYGRRWHRYLQVSFARTRQCIAQYQTREAGLWLDLAAGSGLFTAHQRPMTMQFVGLDLSIDMLKLAKRASPEKCWLQGTGSALPLPAQSVGLLTCISAFHYMENPSAVIQEMHRVLMPGALLVITDWCRDFLAMGALDHYLRHSDHAHQRILTTKELRNQIVAYTSFEALSSTRYRAWPCWGLMTQAFRCV